MHHPVYTDHPCLSSSSRAAPAAHEAASPVSSGRGKNRRAVTYGFATCLAVSVIVLSGAFRRTCECSRSHRFMVRRIQTSDKIADLSLRDDQVAVIAANKPFRDKSVEGRKERIIITCRVQQAACLPMEPYLRPCEHFAELLKGAKAPGQGDEGLRRVSHLRLAFVHRSDYSQFRQPRVRQFPCSRIRTDPNYVPTGCQRD